MLVITRKKSESIVIAGDIKITILWTKGQQVRIGIEAPPHVRIRRAELVQHIAEQLATQCVA